MAAVALAYAPLAPLVPLLAAAVFWVTSIVYKYQLMFVYVTKVESGGVSAYKRLIVRRSLNCPLSFQRLWNVVINRLLFSTVFMHLLMILSTSLRWSSLTVDSRFIFL
jgi:calcium permeable stress-gated cation channel